MRKAVLAIFLLVLAVLIAGCGEKAGEAAKAVSPGASAVSPTEFSNMAKEVAALRADVESLKTQLSYANNRYDSIEAKNTALKSDLNKFTNAVNGRLNLLKGKAGIAGSDLTAWDTYPLTGYSWATT
jgi:peptidoglycan hydrolase CwlO-like protein